MAERTRRTGFRLRDLDGPLRWACTAVIAAFATAPLVAGAIALGSGWQATGDVAVIGLRSRDAWTGHAPLVGQPTTGEEFTGRRSNHPGPVEYWWLGLTTRVLGPRAGIVLGIALVNGAALAGIVWLGLRRGGPELAALLAVALAALVHALGASSLHDAFNSELATYPMVLALLAAWSVAVGDLRVAPILAAAVTVAAQVHVAGAAFCAPLVAVAAWALVDAWRRHRATVGRERAALVGALAVLAVGWLPVVAQELSGGPSNVAALWSTATAPRPRIGLSFMAERLAAAVAPLPAFVRTTGRFGFVDDTSGLGVVMAFAVLGAIAAAAVWLAAAARPRRSEAARLVWLLLGATAVSLVSGAGQPPLAAFRADGTRWLWVVSLGAWVALAWAGHLLAPEPGARRRLVATVGGAAVAGAVLLGTVATARLADERDGRVMVGTDRLADATVAALPQGTYHLAFEGNQALVTVGPGLAYRLEAAGYQVRVDDNAFGRAYGAHRLARTGIDGDLRVVSGTGAAARDGERLVARAVADPTDARSPVVSVFLRAATS
jgi:hypothetical protein